MNLKSRIAISISFPHTVRRPWGDYTVVEEGDRYKVKRIVIKPGQRVEFAIPRA